MVVQGRILFRLLAEHNVNTLKLLNTVCFQSFAVGPLFVSHYLLTVLCAPVTEIIYRHCVVAAEFVYISYCVTDHRCAKVSQMKSFCNIGGRKIYNQRFSVADTGFAEIFVNPVKHFGINIRACIEIKVTANRLNLFNTLGRFNILFNLSCNHGRRGAKRLCQAEAGKRNVAVFRIRRCFKKAFQILGRGHTRFVQSDQNRLKSNFFQILHIHFFLLSLITPHYIIFFLHFQPLVSLSINFP